MSQTQQVEQIDDSQIDMIQDDQIESTKRKQLAILKNGKEFDWVKYKTEQCFDKDCILNDRKKETIFPLLHECERWHNLSDRRRQIIVKDKNKFNYSRLYVRDTDKEDTRYCMNFFEFLYHPQNFRSKECPSVTNQANGTDSNTSFQKDSKSSCIYGMFCPYYHNQIERNDCVNDLKATKYMAAPKEKFTQSLLDDFNNIQSSNKQLEKLYEQMNAQKIVLNSFKGSSPELATPLPKNESPLNEKLNILSGLEKGVSLENRINFNTANALLDNYDDTGFDRNENNILDPINENEEKPANSKNSDTNSQGRSSKGEKAGNKKSYSPKSKTMINLEQKESKKKGQANANKEPTPQAEQKDSDFSYKVNEVAQNGESKFKQEVTNSKKNKKIAEIQQQENKYSSSSLNIIETKSKNDLDITKQASRYTDLSSNDEYLKEFSDVSTQRQGTKTYQYKQYLGHESSTVEFKNYQKLSSCKIQKDMNAILRLQEYGQYICGFLNHKGGTMYIGVHDEGWVDGITLNSKQKDWFNQNIDYVTAQIEPRLVVGEVRINYFEVVGKPCQLLKDSKNYIIELQVVKTSYSDIYFYENNAYIKKQSSLTKMSIQEIKQDLQVKIKKQLRSEQNSIQKIFMNGDMKELDSYNLLELTKFENKLLNILDYVKKQQEELRKQQ